MPIDFPASPTLNQTYTYNGRSWKWDGSAWMAVDASNDYPLLSTANTFNASPQTINGSASAKGLVVKSNATTPGNPLEIQNSGGTAVASISSTGVLTATLTNSTGLPVSTGISGLGTGVATALAVNVGTAGSPVINGGALGTPSSGTLTNTTGLPISTGVSGLGTGVATALAVNVGTAGAPVVNGGALGTPSSGTLTNATGLPISTGVSGLGTNVATFLATPSSANLAAALTDETGTGANVFANTPTLVTPVLGTPTSGTLTNCTGLPVSTGVSGLGTNVATFLGTPSSANLLSAMTDETGTGLLVFATSPTITTPVLTQGTTTPTFTTNIYTVVAGDAGQMLLASNGATAGNVRIPTDASVNYAVGTQIHIVQTNTGQLTIDATTPATTTINSAGATATAPKLRTRWSSATCIKTAANTWLVIGDIV